MLKRVGIALAVVSLVAAVSLAPGCSGSSAAHDSGTPVVSVPKEDPQMSAAITKARSTLPEFLQHLHDPASDEHDFDVKVRLEDGQHVEHVWLQQPVVTTATVSGVINDDVQQVAGYANGQKVTLPTERISDWMFVKGDVLQGGFTIRALYDQMSPADRAQFDKSAPFRMR